MIDDFINLINLYIPYDYIVRVSVLAFLVYFIPTIIVFTRSHRQEVSIILVNILLGWTVVGWFAAMIWSLTGRSLSDGIEQDNPNGHNRHQPVT